MMDIMEMVFEKARENLQRVAFPEAVEEKILQTARELQDKGYCIPVLVGRVDDIRGAAEQFGVSLEGIEIVDAYDEAFIEKTVHDYVEVYPLFSAKSMRRRANADPMFTALMMEANGLVDVTFAGLTHTTGDVILAAQTVIGMKKGISTVSSCGIFNIPGYEGSEGSLLGFGDSAVCVDPSGEDLAGIAFSACETVAALTDWEPRCALLSYSTCGSGTGQMVDKVVEAVKIANKRGRIWLLTGSSSWILPSILRLRPRRFRESLRLQVRPILLSGRILMWEMWGLSWFSSLRMQMPMARSFRASIRLSATAPEARLYRNWLAM